MIRGGFRGLLEPPLLSKNFIGVKGKEEKRGKKKKGRAEREEK